MTNAYCQALGIAVPDLAAAKDHREANTFGLFLVALLERGEAMTLAEVARRFAEAGVAPEALALASLKRCRPGRPPVYRDGDRYALDPRDDELDRWAFRLGLRPPKVPRLTVVRPAPTPLPGPDVALTLAELREAWTGISLYGAWSARRVAVGVLDAHGGPLRPEAALAFVKSITQWCSLSVDEPQFGRRGSPVQVRDDGAWELVPGHETLPATREAVRDRLAMRRKWDGLRPDLAVIEAHRKAFERQRSAHAAELADLRRALLYAFPAGAPEAAVLVDIAQRELQTYFADEFGRLREQLAGYEVIAAENVRALLAKLGFEPGARRLAELAPPQKSKKVNQRGRTLKITTPLLVQGSCGISRPFGDEEKLRQYLRDGQTARFVRRLENDAKALYAYYEYGRLHGAVRLRWGFLDERLPAPWVHRDEPTLYERMRQAAAAGKTIEVVAGSAPDWADPWAKALSCRVLRDPNGYTLSLVTGAGWVVDQADVQAARLGGDSSGGAAR